MVGFLLRASYLFLSAQFGPLSSGWSILISAKTYAFGHGRRPQGKLGMAYPISWLESEQSHWPSDFFGMGVERKK